MTFPTALCAQDMNPHYTESQQHNPMPIQQPWKRGDCVRDSGLVFLKSALRYFSIKGEAQLLGHCTPHSTADKETALLTRCTFATLFCSSSKQIPKTKHSICIFSIKSPQGRGGKKINLLIGKPPHRYYSWGVMSILGTWRPWSRHGRPCPGGKPLGRGEIGPGGYTRHTHRCPELELAPALPPHHTQVTSGPFE